VPPKFIHAVRPSHHRTISSVQIAAQVPSRPFYRPFYACHTLANSWATHSMKVTMLAPHFSRQDSNPVRVDFPGAGCRTPNSVGAAIDTPVFAAKRTGAIREDCPHLSRRSIGAMEAVVSVTPTAYHDLASVGIVSLLLLHRSVSQEYCIALEDTVCFQL